MKIAVNITVELDADVWAKEYGVDRSAVRGDVRSYIENALWSMPVTPDRVNVREAASGR